MKNDFDLLEPWMIEELEKEKRENSHNEDRVGIQIYEHEDILPRHNKKQKKERVIVIDL